MPNIFDGKIFDLDSNEYTTLNNALLDLEKDTLSHYAKDLLIQYKKYAGQDGKVYPSIKTLAAKVICSERSIQAAKRELKEKGYILCFNRYNNDPESKLYKQQLSSGIVLLKLNEDGNPQKLDEILLEKLKEKVNEIEKDFHIVWILEDTYVKDLRKNIHKKNEKKLDVSMGESYAPREGAPNSSGGRVNPMHQGGESHAPKNYDIKTKILEEDEDAKKFNELLEVFKDNIDNFNVTPKSKKLEFLKALYTLCGYEYIDKLIEHCCSYKTNNPYGYFKKTAETFIINKINNVKKLEIAIDNWQDFNLKLKEKERAIRIKRANSLGSAISTTMKKDNFNNYQQREYDFDDLEKKLLGWDTEE